MRLGLMGGTFDPIHNAHLFIARAAREAVELDSVLFLPAGNPPHKAGLSPAQDRLEMTRLAVEPLPWAQVSDMETARQGTIYTVDTLTMLRKLRPDDRLFYIVGADTLRDMPTWRDASRAMTMCELVAVSRPGMSREDVWQARDYAIAHTGAKVTLVEADSPDISSTMIRAAAALGQNVSRWTPPAVAEYIARKGLYR